LPRLLVVSLALLFLASPLHAQQQQPPAASAKRLSKIEFSGLERVSQPEAVAASGLQVGQPIDVDKADAAAQRLLDSGLFSRLGYEFTASGNNVVISFKVEEMKRGIPVVFDNFVWFSDEELAEAVRRKMPSYDGTAPESGGATDTITKALTDLLRERKIEGTVEYMPSVGVAGKNPEHVFTVKGANTRVCAVRYPGAAALKESVLVQNSSGILNNEYSRKFASGYAESSLLPLYHQRGHLRAAFLTPKVKLEKTPECEDGVTVTVPVEEGAAYVWDKAEWSGASALSAQELDAALGMSRNDIADGLKIERGKEAARKAYARKGYLAPTLSAAPDFDDANRRVTFRFNVNEGPQYRMGALYIEGLSEKDANNMRVRWRLLSKEVYDAGYLDEYVKVSVPELVKEMRMESRAPASMKLESAVRPDHEKLIVDVTLTFKQEAAK
jgi:outer membrane protein assembly factor BamA